MTELLTTLRHLGYDDAEITKMTKIEALKKLQDAGFTGPFDTDDMPAPADLNALSPTRPPSVADLVEASRVMPALEDSNPNGHHPTEEPEPGKDKKPATPDDAILAARWIGQKMLTAWGMGEFRRYLGGVWAAVDLDEIRKEVKAVVEAARPEGVRVTSGRLESTLELARVDLARRSDSWDSDPDYLVCKNGTLHIPTKTLQPHNPEIYATSGLDFDYNPEAKAPVFEYVLERCIPGAADFVQEFAGYALTIDTSHEIAVWFYGPPGSGKSTILTGLQAMLGARAGLLGLADIERSRFALTNLPGKTLVISTEQPDFFIAATHILNAIISGETIAVDRKFRQPVDIKPRAKVAWAMNDLPRVNGANNGVMRRVKVVKFPALAEDERDPTIKERIKNEGAGILNWGLVGLARLRARGRFVVPDCVIEATNEFRDSNDIPALFLEESGALRGDDHQTTGGQLYDRYKAWCIETGHKPQSSTTIANDWRRLGLDRRRMAGKTYWRGVEFPIK